MRKIVLALAAVAAIGIAVPTFAATPAAAHGVVVVKKNAHRQDDGQLTTAGTCQHRYHRNHYHRHHHRHYGWR